MGSASLVWCPCDSEPHEPLEATWTDQRGAQLTPIHPHGDFPKPSGAEGGLFEALEDLCKQERVIRLRLI